MDAQSVKPLAHKQNATWDVSELCVGGHFDTTSGDEIHITAGRDDGQVSVILRLAPDGSVTLRCTYAQGTRLFVFRTDGKTVEHSEWGR